MSKIYISFLPSHGNNMNQKILNESIIPNHKGLIEIKNPYHCKLKGDLKEFKHALNMAFVDECNFWHKNLYSELNEIKNAKLKLWHESEFVKSILDKAIRDKENQIRNLSDMKFHVEILYNYEKSSIEEKSYIEILNDQDINCGFLYLNSYKEI